ncbi:MAG: serine/threonine-protein kinase, partial [bacterium]|nr:serine/threonine-protein kinase [bacterium]
MTEREIFLEALEVTTPEARAAYLQGACGRDVALRCQLDELLNQHFSNDSLLAGPALEGAQSTVVVAHPKESGAQMIGRYKLLEKIGEGGFGEVWMAEQREPVKRRVALKLIKLGMDSRQIVARFEAERQALAMMDHPNIAKIFDADVTDTGRPYFVMELVRGTRITDYCDQNQLSTRERLCLFIKVCQAIQHAHQKGVIHRDIKPSNILVTLHDGVPVPKVIDFGIAKATQQELTDKTVFTQFQQFIGTPAYISPEQAEMSGLDIDTRADIYSLGVLLYELLVGQTPFDAKEMMQGGLDALRKTIREVEPLRPSTKLNTLPAGDRTTAGKRRHTDAAKLMHQLQGDLDWIVMKCLEKDRTRRYDTANGLAMDLQRHLTNEPVVARPPSVVYQLQKAWQRNRLVFSAAAAVAIALVVGLGISLWGAIRATEAKTIAIQAQTEAESSQRKAEAERQRADGSQRYSRRLHYASD